MTPDEIVREGKHLLNLPVTESRSEHTRALLRRAEDAGHTEPALTLRLDLLHIDSELCGRTPPKRRGPRLDRMRVDFTRILDLYDRHPEYFGEAEEEFLWITASFFVEDLMDRAAAPVTELTAFVDDLERRFLPTGVNRTELLMMRRCLADGNGPDETLDDLEHGPWRPGWTRQDFVEQRVKALKRRGDHEGAVEAARPLLEGEVRSVNPDGSPTDIRLLLVDLMESYLRTGCAEQAREAYRSTTDLLRVNRWRQEGWHRISVGHKRSPLMTERLEFLVASGNEDRAPVLFWRLPPLVDPVYDHSQLYAARAVALVCRRLVEAGRGMEGVESVDIYGRARIGVAELYRDRAEHAMRFAGQVDACRGNDRASRATHDFIHDDPEVVPLDLGPEPAWEERD